jgi:NCK adaptor protein 2
LAAPYRGAVTGNGSNGSGGESMDRRNDRNDSLSRQQQQPLPAPPISSSVGNGGANGGGPQPPHLVGKSWYYGAITRNQCDTVLNQHGHDGDYLIRDSETNVSIILGFFFSITCLSKDKSIV